MFGTNQAPLDCPFFYALGKPGIHMNVWDSYETANAKRTNCINAKKYTLYMLSQVLYPKSRELETRQVSN